MALKGGYKVSQVTPYRKPAASGQYGAQGGAGGSSYGRMSSGRTWGGRSHWRSRRGYGYGPQGGDGASQWALGIQACLAQLLGPWVPQNGIIGPRTRRAVQIFQGQQQMPVTGLLDQATAGAIQAACSGQAPGPPVGAVAPPPPPAPPPMPPPSASPPSAPPEAAGPPDEAGEAEINSETVQEAGHELRVDGPCQVHVDWHDTVSLASDQQFRWAPESPAVYVVYVRGKPWHVGIAKHSLRSHLLARARELQERQIPLRSQADRSLAWVVLCSGSAPPCAIQQRRGQDPTAPFQPVHAKHAMLRILKRFLVKKLQTGKQGNLVNGKVQFGPNGSITIFDKGRQVVRLSSSSQL
jgi:peptidoglycan hydrolase-like protein with peptidoglycan-binding domain